MPLNPLNDVFVFQPGSTGPTRFDAGTQVYTDWAELYAELTASTAFQKTVVIDDTYVNQPTIPAGTYDFAGVRLVGRWSIRDAQQGLTFLVLSNGVVIEDCPWIENIYINLSAGVDDGFFNYDSGTDITLETRRAFLLCGSGSTPLINVSNTTTFRLIMERSRIGGSNGNVIYLTAADTLVPGLRNASEIFEDSLNAPVGATIADVDIAPGSKIDPTQTQWAGTLPAFDSASDVVYDPSTPGNWSATPSDVGTALNALAVRANLEDDHTTSIAVSPGNTVNEYYFAPYTMTLVGVNAYCHSGASSAAGVYTLAVEANGNNLLSAATFDMETTGSLPAATLTAVPLTGTTANLDLNQGVRISIQLVSDNADLVAEGVYIQLLFKAQ